jgi:hypothetical protein
MVTQRAVHRPRCPECGGPLDRIPRRFVDRFRSLFTPLRRYRCVALTCHWEGTIEDRHVALPAHAEKKRYERRIDAP